MIFLPFFIYDGTKCESDLHTQGSLCASPTRIWPVLLDFGHRCHNPLYVWLQIGSMADIIYPHSCRPITDDLGSDELVRRLKVCILIQYKNIRSPKNVSDPKKKD